MKRLNKALWLVPVLLVVACGDESTNPPIDPNPPVDTDSGTTKDTGEVTDIGTTTDTGTPKTDAGTPKTDTGTPTDDIGTPKTDTGTPTDDMGTPTDDMGTAVDAGTPMDDTGTATDAGSRPDVPGCTAGQRFCGTVCVDTNTDNTNCGLCGFACAAGQSCQVGVCRRTCVSGQSLCGDVCATLDSDPANCGGCGNTCPTGQMCVAGACALTCSAPRTVCTTAAGVMNCVDTLTDGANCGLCGLACATGQSCVAGMCRLGCPAGQTACGGACVDTNTSNANCGGCGLPCATGQSCAAGMCRRDCGTGETRCGDACIDTATNSTNCGACGVPCTAGQTCTAGACVAGAPANDLPAGAVVISLATPSSTITGTTTAATNTQTDCGQGDVYYRFTLAAREVVYADTFGTSYDTLLAFAPASGVGIIAGSCSDDSCTELQSQLTRVLDPGTYYVVVSGYRTNRGAFTLHFQHLPIGSGAVTQITSLATGSQTFTGTTSGTGVLAQSCPVATAAGPETSYWFSTCPAFTATQFRATTCGGATWDTVLEQRSAARPVAVCNDDSCSLQSTITATIASGAGLHTLYVDGYGTAAGAYTLGVTFGSCPTGQNFCGATCTDLQTNVANCGACGTVCTAPVGGSVACAAGACVRACPTGQTNCGGTCRAVATDASNCGACGTVCAAPFGGTTSCVAGGCVAACPTGQTNCGGTCRNLATDNANCGACGAACSAPTTCVASACRPTNNDRASAVAITLATAEVTVSGSTVNATADGPTDCGGALPNVWYSVTTTAAEVLYVDTAGSAYDTRLSLVNSAGTTVANTCNDDSDCTTGGFTSINQSRFAVDLPTAGTYYINVSGYIATSTGAFTLHVQHIPHAIGSYFYTTRITGSGSDATLLVGTNAQASATCGGGASGEDARWFMTCGAQNQFFSLCRSDVVGGVTATYVRRNGTTNYDPSMYIRSAQTGAEVTCNDDGGTMGGTNCSGTGTGADTFAYGSRINNVAAPRGINAAFVDERTGGTGMNYTVVYTVR